MISATGCLVAAIGVGFLYYFFGNYNMPGSRSYFLEKEIRTLLYFETHDAVDYARVADRYRFLLARIRFGDFGLGYSERYNRALKRTEQKIRIIALIDAYMTTGDAEKVREAEALLQSLDYQKLEEYNFTSLWYRGVRVIDNSRHSPRILLERNP